MFVHVLETSFAYSSHMNFQLKKNLSFQKLWIGSQGEIVYLRSHSLALNSSWGRFKAPSLIFVFLLFLEKAALGC